MSVSNEPAKKETNMKLNEAREYAIEKMVEHRLIRSEGKYSESDITKDYYKNWVFDFDNAKRRFGHCDYGKKKITISKALTELNNEEEVKDTILHEIAHALTLGTSSGHDKIWKEKCIEIGAEPTMYYSKEVKGTEARFVFKCKGCGLEIERHKASKFVTRYQNYTCGSCGGRFERIK